ncbi:sugar phosphate isomerase/epimerase and 4-hydroxyphenylpyruvate domain-containing protein [Lacihabitans sp. CCS-44]|uniref:sugar phosphate isomerase/epimerase and 4-hydroxyphenylpyruvate domain-containing protein n=1 Tax=Lacihabitans sp. CCS-44 TaxID=2487331 RepID=UPI0020CBB84E|nr:sugar phosphate isomerase/epimerase and 4-hydroxyphenylpyruvate domain-containing protein [Lacihabitans sp. CCS-44]MCP9755466.1 sugar phosphate isomerase/epimerase and 4-hydroxyphenylpyruvate domain-containing protein [Lacihabitans sp. CCS-44]
MFKHSIASVSLPGTLQEKIYAVAKAGYDGIELFENDLTVSNLCPKELRIMTSDLGIEIVGLQPFRDFEAMPIGMHLQNLERAKYKLDLANELGTNKLFVCSNTSPFAINAFDLASEQLHALATLAEKQKVEIGYEALSWGRYVNTYIQSVEIVNRANHPNLGHILDNYHIGVVGTPIDDIYKINGDKITIAQIADAPFFEMSPMYLGRHYRCFPGQGSYPVIEYMQAIIATGYRGYISHEIFSDDFRSGLLEPVAEDGKRSLVWVTGIAENPLSKVKVSDFEFVEFSVRSGKQMSLLYILENLGFAETHTHKTLDTSVFQNGHANIVINMASDQGVEPRVMSVGLSTLGIENIEHWAGKLKYNWQENSKNNWLDSPSIKSLGDLSFYLIDKNPDLSFFRENEFLPTQNEANENGIFRIDHLGHAVNPDDFHANTLFYRTMLGLEIEQSLDLFDPNGIVNSRVVKETEFNNIRISLSSTKSRNTNMDRFKSHSENTEIQQIAFASHDIFKTAQCIKDKHIILPIPSNYYQDLKSKFLVDQATLFKMEKFNILVDKNADGMFFHFYLKEINGLFFEIVQRVGQYDRYGEINAQLRLTAQSRDHAQS